MSDNDMFNQNSTPNTPATPEPGQDNLFDDKLKSIVNDQGQPKYADVDTALDALAASQKFIEKLKAEKAAEEAARQAIEDEKNKLESDLEKMGSIDDFVKKLNPNAKPNEPAVTPPVNNGLSEEKVAELLQKQLEQRDVQSQQERNLTEVTNKLSEMYGDKSAEHIKQKAQELGTTTKGLKDLSMSNPTMALALLGTPAKSAPKPSQPSTLNLTAKPNEDPTKPKWDKSATRGGFTSKEMAERWKESSAYTNKRLGLEI